MLYVYFMYIWFEYAKMLRKYSLTSFSVCLLSKVLFENGLTNQLEFHNFSPAWSENDLMIDDKLSKTKLEKSRFVG